jgi:hypothetical protein
MTADMVFEALDIPIEQSHLDQNDALAALAAGKLDAAIFVVGKPAKLFTAIAPANGLHFLAIPPNPALLATYLPAQITHEDYPGLVPPGETVDTVAVGSVMAIFNIPPGSERYRLAASFVDGFFGNFDKFLAPPRHPKWREVNLAADLPGWKRFDPAADWLRRHDKRPDAALHQAFEIYLEQQAKETGSPDPSPEQKAALFEQFRQWQKATGAASTAPPAPAAAKPHPRPLAAPRWKPAPPSPTAPPAQAPAPPPDTPPAD